MNVPCWRRRAGQSDQVSFGCPIESFRAMSTGGTALQGSSETVLDKLLAHSPNGRGAYIQRLTDLLVRPTWSVWARISFEQDTCMKEFACRCFSGGNHLLETYPIFCGESDDILLIHAFLLEFFCLTQGYDTVCQLLKWWWSDH
jgi:hypothetical protein